MARMTTAALARRHAMPAMRPTLVAALLSLLLGGVLAHGLIAQGSSAASRRHVAEPSRAQLSQLPLSARAPVSGAIGAADYRYRVSASAGGFQAVNPGQRLHVGFERRGVQLSSGLARFGLSLGGLGYGQALHAVGATLSGGEANRVTYTGDGVSEWYTNGPLGLEQGFTVSNAPAGPQMGPLTLALALSGNVRAALAPGASSVLLARGASSLRYGDLLASDARGHVLHSWLVVHGSEILVRVDTQGAVFPLRIDPLVQQAKLTGEGEESGEGHLGVSVALSADGDTALVGAPGDDDGAGAAWVFTRSGATWTQAPKLTAGEAAGDSAIECELEEPVEEEATECGFGRSVALSGDGDTALVGGPGANGNLGAAWVFVRSGEGWTLQGPPLTGGAESLKGHFGRSVALSADGDTALIGAPGDAGYKGAAWVFTRAGTSWSEQAKLTAGEGGVADFGLSVALSGDGTRALIGAPASSGGVGAAWVFSSSEAVSWTQQSKLQASGESGEGHFGYSVALSADAGTALVGGRGREGTVGAAWAFTSEGAAWSAPESLSPAGEGGDLAKFGYSVALSADGDTALVGNPGAFGSVGGAWLFTRSGTTFGPGEALTATGERGNGRLGTGVALAADGATGLLGAPSDSGRAGAAWSFVAPAVAPQVTAVSPPEGPSGGGTEVTITGSNLGEATAVEFGSVAAPSFTVNPEGTSITAISPKEPARKVNVTVDSPGFTSATSESDLFTFVAPAKKGGHREEPEPGSPPGGNEIETPVNVQSTPNGPSGSETIVAGSVLAFGPTTGPACAVTLLGKSAKVRKRARAALKLNWKGATGAVVCRGKLTLAVRVKLKGAGAKRYKTVVIGTASFSILPGKTKLITVRLNAAGRSRLHAANRRGLAARLTILVSTPGPRRALTHAIRLVLQHVAQSRQSATLS
jgi:IPT/TIG domain/FG-GAP repeat